MNGKIVTLDSASTITDSFATTTDGFISSIGPRGGISPTLSGTGDVVDLRGRTVVPGFIDGHAHMDREGLKFLLVSLDGVRSIDDVLERIEAEVHAREPGEWVVTMPIGDYPEFAAALDLLAEGRYPTRRDLDVVSPDNPVYIRGAWYYWNGESPIVSIANSYALHLAHVTRNTAPSHTAIEISRDVDGEPDGVFRESGQIGTVEYTIMDVVPQFSEQDRVVALRDSMRRYNAAGTTSVYEGHGVAPAVIDAYCGLHWRDEMTVRSHLVVSPTWDLAHWSSIGRAVESILTATELSPVADNMLRIDGIHIEMGPSQQDDVRKRASSNPGWAGYSVDSVFPPDRGSLRELMLAAANHQIRVNAITHSQELLEDYLSALEHVHREVPIADRRWVLQHLSFVDDGQLQRLATLGVHTTIVPGTTMWKHGLYRTAALSEAEANRYLPFASFSRHEVPFAFGTDNVPIEPLKSIWSAVTRQDATSGTVVGERHRLTREDALRAFTMAGAALTFEERLKGSLEVGKLADFAVLSDDPLTVPADDIRDIEVVVTVVGGRIVHDLT